MPLSDRTWVIAEAGVNHNGSLGLALQLIDAATLVQKAFIDQVPAHVVA